MARAKVPVNANELQKEIESAERKNKGPFKNLSKLFADVADRPWAKSRGITAAVVALRYSEFGLKSKTVPGRTVNKPVAIPSSAPIKRPELAPHLSAPVTDNTTITGVHISSNVHAKKYVVDGKKVSPLMLIAIAHEEGYGVNGEDLLKTSGAANFLRAREHTVTEM